MYFEKIPEKRTCTVSKGISAALAVSVLCTMLTGCGITEKSDSTDNQKEQSNSSPLNVSLDHSYTSEEIKIEGMESIGNVTILGNNLLIQGSDASYQEKTCIYHMADSSCEEVTFAYPASLDEKTDCYPVSFFLNADGNLTCVFHSYIWDESNEEEPYQEIGYTLETYDENLNVLETKDVNEIIGEDAYFNRMVTDSNGNYYMSASDKNSNSSMIYVYDKDFHKTGEIKDGFQYVDNILPCGDSIVVSYQDETYNYCFGIVNTENNTVEKVDISGIPSWFNSAVSGDGMYDFYLSDSTSAYGVSMKDKTCTEVINWINSDFTGDTVQQVLPMQDGRFLMTTYPYSSLGSQSGLYILTERDPETLRQMQMITMSVVYLPSELATAVNQFNRNNSEYRIVVADYSKYNTEDDWEAGINQLKDDMASGIVADIICTDGLPYENFVSKGIFQDLTSYVDTLDKDAYFMNFFDALRYGEKFYHLAFCFSVRTLEAKSEFVGNKNGISIQEFAELIQSLPDDMKAFSEMSKDTALYNFCLGNLNAFISPGDASCHFDTPTFAELLELCNTYPAENTEKDTWEDTEWENFWLEQQYQYINNKVLLREVYLSDVKSYLNDRYTYFDTAPVTQIGYPTLKENSNGGQFSSGCHLAISANSENQEQAWKFFESTLSESYQEQLSWSIPVRKEAFDKMAQKALEPDTYIDENGVEQVADNIVYRGDEAIDMPLPTRQDVEAVKSYIEGITENSYYDEQVYTIVQEEAEKYFSGDQNAQEAASVIQSRVSIYLAEQS